VAKANSRRDVAEFREKAVRHFANFCLGVSFRRKMR
jgi:hypothetical protein